MIELLGLLPIVYVVAALAIVSKLALVRIRMAREAILRQPEKRLRQILVLNQRALRGQYIFRRVAQFSGKSAMLAFERIAGQLVVELIFRRIPMDEREICTVVLQMTPHAIFSIRVAHFQASVIAVIGGEVLRHFLVAFEALERWRLGAELMAARALRRSRQ